MNDESVPALLPVSLNRDMICEGHATLGIDIQPVGRTPRGERVRIYFSADNSQTLTLEEAHGLFGGSEPILVSPWEYQAVFAD